ncbi:MAG: NAD-dependent epimerase/dehydratase family protein [Bacteriovoracaceae bacterium]|nr:NAD-dependent epimerase/dehydratase family protein [Bacteriovoracaceae bacterium]
MKVFITGGGGFLGQHIVRKLIEKGHTVTSYSRGTYPELETLGVKAIQGSLEDKEHLLRACMGHDAFFHVASKVAMWGRVEDFTNTNVTGTKNALEAARKSGIKSFIYTSTPSVVFGDKSLKGVNEDTPYPPFTYSRYGSSKALAEKIVLENNDESFKTISLRPHLVFGPGDKNLIPRLIDSAKKKKLKIIGDGKNQVDVLYVENAADAHLMAWEALLKKPEIVGGQAYFIGQGPVNLWGFINKILARYELAPIEKKVSFKVAFFLGGLIERGASLFRKFDWHPPMTRFVALQLSKDHYFSHELAYKDLGWKPKISIDEALSRLI